MGRFIPYLSLPEAVPRGSADTMRFLLVAFDFKPQPGGIAEYSHHVAAGLDRRGHEVIVLTLQRDKSESYDEKVPFRVHRADLPDSHPDGPRYQWAVYRTVRDAIETQDPDWLLHNALDKATHACWLAARQTDRPLCTFVHGTGIRSRVSRNPLDYENPLSWLIERSRMKSGTIRADRVVTVSDFTRRNLERAGVDADRITLVPPLIADTSGWTADDAQIEALHERFAVGDRDLILTVARLVERKGVDTVLESLAEHRSELPDLRYVVAGDGPDRDRLEAMTEDLGLRDTVTFAGFVDSDVKHHLYEIAEIFVMPNRELDDGDVEGFGIVFLEANAHGIPVVGGRSGGAVDAIVDGETGILVDPRDPDDVTAAIGRLLGDDDVRSAMGEKGRKRVEEELDFGANLDTLVSDLRADLDARKPDGQPPAGT